ncbi:MAG TPA: methylated-DNA--[protein]-cysteine S-methyltransferase, partial [Anaerovoracaceae bacterium]|nr:methylated-DNA--[protein]-cysteine S-methyltransferase [Anaerovoracaceae bacterium]
GEKCVFSELINNQLNEYFSGKRKIFDIPHILKGTDFQLKVWNAINNITYGKTKSYKEIAEYINYPKAYRAVGLACNKNPIPFTGV